MKKKVIIAATGLSAGTLMTATMIHPKMVFDLYRIERVKAESTDTQAFDNSTAEVPTIVSEDIFTWMPDENLQNALKGHPGIKVETLERKHLLGMPDLFLANKGIADIKGLEFAEDLIVLELRGNEISDMSILNNFQKLGLLELAINNISTISGLSNLPSLRTLYLSSNKISDISRLNDLPALYELWLNDNKINGLSGLNGLPSLQLLTLDKNEISDLSLLADLPSLRHLSVDDNRLSDISGLKEFPSLSSLQLNNNQISDISVLKHLPLLRQMNLGNNQISDISVLKNLGSLSYLYLDNNQITNFDDLNENLSYVSLGTQNKKLDELSVAKDLDENVSINYKSLFGKKGSIEYIGDGKYNRDTGILKIPAKELLDGIINLEFKLGITVNKEVHDVTVNIEQPIVFEPQGPTDPGNPVDPEKPTPPDPQPDPEPTPPSVENITSTNIMTDKQSLNIYDSNGKKTGVKNLKGTTDFKTTKKVEIDGEVYFQISDSEWIKESDTQVFHANKSVVRTHVGSYKELVTLTGEKVKNRALSGFSNWSTGRFIYINGEKYYQVSTHEWIHESHVIEYTPLTGVVTPSADSQLYDAEGNKSNRGLKKNASFYTDMTAEINGQLMYRVSTNEWIPADAVVFE